MSDLHALRNGFTDEHLPMYLLLGLVSSLDRVAALLGKCGLSPDCSRESADAATGEVDDVLAALLGLIALHHKVDELKPPMPIAGAADAAGAEHPMAVRELLR